MAETARPSTELGYVHGGGTEWQQWDHTEKVPELQWPESVNVFSRMGREDGRASSLLRAIGLPIRRTGWHLDPNGARDEVVEFVARNLRLGIKGSDYQPTTRTRGRFSWRSHLQQALLMLQYGHSFFEQVYQFDQDGRISLRKLAPRPQRTIAKINVALDGGLESITQQPPVGKLTAASAIPDGFTIPVSRLVAYVHEPDPGQWQGNSILRPAYKHWILKDEFMRTQAAAARRNGIGVPVGTAASATDQVEVDHMRDLASNFKGGMTSGVGLANGQKLELLSVQGVLLDIQKAIDYQDKQIAIAGLAHFLNLDTGGSFAMASVQEGTFTQSVQTLGETIADVGTAHVVEDLVDLNWGEDEPAPKIVFDEIGSRQDLTASALKMLIDAGLIRLDRSLEEYTRQQYGLPAKDTPPPSEPWTPPSGPTETEGTTT
ncbi:MULTISPECIES: hypothetical protein [unclassified Rhodococcus (in: high G+C Gram-positive bacteria)]|uniref:phage portal protein family protein n=1 Tax=unclassified Rhodococcus (in: high G+C Gram-positive bacteria) TaxID=192944 RepID=UPI0009039C7B|nr:MULTISPECIES: hypothetical protein [unclassified Rhodococcus (in: high G+C Gram-positive bacteria)]APE11017.1 hypothetical protein BO226_18940 [Rhodococcus sp. 2G]QXU53622.1 DUF935 domain-containing protein [Rhodococcus sp. LW-XY12]